MTENRTSGDKGDSLGGRIDDAFPETVVTPLPEWWGNLKSTKPNTPTSCEECPVNKNIGT